MRNGKKTQREQNGNFREHNVLAWIFRGDKTKSGGQIKLSKKDKLFLNIMMMSSIYKIIKVIKSFKLIT